jgi:hypothetical protein
MRAWTRPAKPRRARRRPNTLRKTHAAAAARARALTKNVETMSARPPEMPLVTKSSSGSTGLAYSGDKKSASVRRKAG